MVLHLGFQQLWVLLYCSMYLLEKKNPCVSGPTQFQPMLLKGQLYSSSQAAVTKCYKLGGLKQPEFILSQIESRGLKSRCHQGHTPSEILDRILLCLS